MKQQTLARSGLRVLFLLMPVTAVLGSRPAAASPTIDMTIKITKYNIDIDADPASFFPPDPGSFPDPRIRIVAGGQSTQTDFDYPCSVWPPGVGCVVPNPPPQDWIDISPDIVTGRTYVFKIGEKDPNDNMRDTFLVPFGITLIDRDPSTEQRMLSISATANLYDKTITGNAFSNPFSGTVGQEVCGFQGKNGVCFIIEGDFGDADGDGLLDIWEQNRAVPTEIGTMLLPNADPDHKDIYVELDFTQGFQPTKAVIDRVKDAFARAPFFTGGFGDTVRGVRLHVDTGGLMENGVLVGDNLGGGGLVPMVDPNWCGLWDGATANQKTFFHQTKDARFNAMRSGIFHYAISKDIVNCDPCNAPVAITNATNATPIVITTAKEHEFTTGTTVNVVGVNGNTNANGTWVITVTSPTRFRLDGTAGNGAFTGGGTAGQAGSGGGCGEFGGDDSVFRLRRKGVLDSGGGARALQSAENDDAATLMHELGHNLGLRHGGDEKHNCKPNYLSVMNYFYFDGIRHSPNAFVLDSLIDFSPPLTIASAQAAADPNATRMFLGNLDENALNETVPLSSQPGFGQRTFVFVDGTGDFVTQPVLATPVNWDGMGIADLVMVPPTNIDINPTTGAFAGQFPACNAAENTLFKTISPAVDWAVISMRFTQSTDASASGPTPVPGEPTLDRLEAMRQARAASDLGVTITGQTQVQVGGTATLTVQVTNVGPNHAQGTLNLALSPGITHASNNGGCTGAGTGPITCAIAALEPNQSRSIVVVVNIGANTAMQSRFAQALVVNDSGMDPAAANNQAMHPLMLPPTLTVPPPLTTDQCQAPNLGTATATSETGQSIVPVPSPPAVFPLGVTMVRWTATDSRGLITTKDQTVTTFLGNNSSCCPAGTRVLVGTSGDNTIVGTSSNECILGLGGHDTLQGGGGFDFIAGGSGNDTITGGTSRDYIWGGSGTDSIDAAGGDDFIDGGADTDNCSGGTGTNAIRACETASHCNASCCSSQSCTMPLPPPPLGCQPAYAKSNCLSYVQGVRVSRNGRNWECTNGNCANCATHASCEPGASGCPWGVVWTDRGSCP